MRRSSRSSSAANAEAPSAEQHSDAAMQTSKPAKPRRASSSTRATKAKAEATAEEQENEQHGSDAEDTTAAAEDEPRPKRRHAAHAASSSSSSSAAAAASSAAAAAAPSHSDDEAEAEGDEDAPADDIEALAAAAGVSVYEYNRQQNIRLKNEQLQALNLAGMASDIGLRRTAPAPRSSSKRKAREPAVGVRRSGRSAGVPAEIYVPELTTSASSTWGRPDRKEGPLSFAEALGLGGAAGAAADEEEEGAAEEEKEGAAAMEDEAEESKQSDNTAAAAAVSGSEAAAAGTSKSASFTAEVESVLSALTGCLRLSTPSALAQASAAVVASYGQKGALGLGQMRMAGEGVKIIKSRATVLSFHPTAAIDSPASIVAVGDKEGNVSLARYSNKAAQKDWASTVQVARFAPHTQSVVGLLWGSAAQSHSLYSASQDGSVRRMDLETQQWLEAYVASDDGDGVSAVCMAPDYSALYCGDRGGVMTIADLRAGHTKHAQHTLSTHKLNGLSVNPLDGHMLASCGNERKVRVWDVRNLSKALREWTHGFSVNAVTFSPSGRMMAATGYEDSIKLMSCVDAAGALLSPTEWAAEKSIKHDNHTGRWVTTFRSMFAPADAALAIGNMKRAIDVYTFPAVDSAALAAAASSSSAAAAAAAPSNGNGKKKRGGAAAAAAASSSSSSSASSSFSKSGPSVPAPQPSPVLSLTHAEFVTSIPSAVAWEPNRVAVGGCTSSGRLYVFGHFGK